MLRSQGPFAPLEKPDLTWDPAGFPRSKRFEDGYFGSAEAIAESRHVFIDGSDLPERLRDPARECFTVGELGFGTGLNFLLTWELFAAAARPEQRLHYLAIESRPLHREQRARVFDGLSGFENRSAALSAALPPPIGGLHRRSFEGGRVTLDLYYASAAEALADIESFDRQRVHAWYLDGFAPSRNPEMWRCELFHRMARASADGASIATYSAAGQVRRDLETAGFAVERRPGFGRKRECLRGTLERRPVASGARPTPWDLPDSDARPERRALVLGAGLAGAHVAAALAQRGWAVTVADAGPVAGRASGNPQGLLFTRLSHQRSTLADFSLLAYLYAAHRYAGLFAAGSLTAGRDGALDGCFQTPAPRGDFDALSTALVGLEDLAENLDASAASGYLGVTPARGGLWMPASGWLSPPAVCRALLDHPAIRILEACGALDLEQDPESGWRLRSPQGAVIASAPVAVICAGSAGRTTPGLDFLPLKVARGQTTQIPQPPGPALERAFCHRGYLAPAAGGEHCIGATFNPGDDDCGLRTADHERNLADLAAALPAWGPFLAGLDPAELRGRAELRCVSPDYLPAIGPVPDIAAFRTRYGALARDARRTIDRRGAFVPGLFVSTAHGSRGLSYAALGAEVLASQICDEPPPLSRELSRAVAPARFAIRAIVRGEA